MGGDGVAEEGDEEVDGVGGGVGVGLEGAGVGGEGFEVVGVFGEEGADVVGVVEVAGFQGEDGVEFGEGGGVEVLGG